MDVPESTHGRNAARVQALLQAVFQKGGRRQLLLLALFAVLVVTASRRGTNAASPDAAVQHADPVAVLPAATGPAMPVGSLSRQSPEAVALDNLLSRYDVLIRLLETRGVDSPRGSDPALGELRAMRASLYETSRRAIQSTKARNTPPG